MEADWEIESGGEAPIIDARWAGFVDLRHAPQRSLELPEAAGFPALAEALIRLNAPASTVETSKCDVWRPDAFDPDELDAPGNSSSHAIACYIDILPAGDSRWHSPDSAISWCRNICNWLRHRPLRCCRADLIVRRAFFAPVRTPHQLDFGVTAYLTACGPTAEGAAATLASALAVLADSILTAAPPTTAASKLQ
jgi:hypothetical protein